MSWNVALFVEGVTSLKALAGEVSTLSGLELKCVHEDESDTYQCSVSDFTLIVREDHELENDRDMNFEDYPYQVCLWRHNPADRVQAQANTLEFAKILFEKFKDTGRYRLMLVEDTQKKLASFGLTTSCRRLTPSGR